MIVERVAVLVGKSSKEYEVGFNGVKKIVDNSTDFGGGMIKTNISVYGDDDFLMANIIDCPLIIDYKIKKG